ncbi:MAG: zf-TFIIB domain-containing protein [Arenibacterium sp.]
MKWPICQDDLKMTERQGVEIDYCPKCRGVWLDRGELDKIIEKSTEPMVLPDPTPPPAPEPRRAEPPREWREPYRERDEYDDRYRDDRYREDRRYDKKSYKRKKRKSFLGEIFDFDFD